MTLSTEIKRMNKIVYNYFYAVINRNYKTDVECPIIIILLRIDSNICYKDYFPNFRWCLELFKYKSIYFP